MTDPRYSDPRLSDPVLRRDEAVGETWGWIAGVAVLVLIAFLLIAGWNNNSNTASNNNASPSTVSPPTTTGSGSTSPRPTLPAKPMMPEPNKSSTQ